MKRIFAFILAALLLISAVSCGGNQTPVTDPAETKSAETSAPETAISETDIDETDPAETEAPSYAYDTSLITENGIAKAHIVLPQGATDLEKTAADELAYHIKLVSGAEVSITDTIGADSLPIIIATPDSLPELEELFPEDLSWLRATSEPKENGGTQYWGDDGFSIRMKDGKIYIFGATNVGALNGTYDFIEENLDVIWIGNTDAGIIYDEMPTITAVSTDYREKSPFFISTKGASKVGIFDQRNKLYVTDYLYGAEHCAKDLVLSSPIYDPNITEYWDTDSTGKPLNAAGTHSSITGAAAGDSKQINYWSRLTAETVAASIIAKLDAFADESRPTYYNFGMEDHHDPYVYPEVTQPFEYAPGQFVEPGDSAYFSTIYFTFLNKVVEMVTEKYPDVHINTIAYMFAVIPPKCDIHENVTVWFCPIQENYCEDDFETAAAKAAEGSSAKSVQEALSLAEWVETNKNNQMILYNYYFCHYVCGWYERPIWTRLQNDFRCYADAGFVGSTICAGFSEGNNGIVGWQRARTINPDSKAWTGDQGYRMNIMTMWIYNKLMWNPYEDVEALIVEFCDKVYGEASPIMQEYYDLLELGWAEGASVIPESFNADINVDRDARYYYDYFLDFDMEDGTYYLDAVRDVLQRAYDAADDKAKTFIEWPLEVYQDWTRFLD